MTVERTQAALLMKKHTLEREIERLQKESKNR